MSKQSPQNNVNSRSTPVKRVQILLVEDERHLAESISNRLNEEGYLVDVTHDGEEAVKLGISKKYQLVILDLLLPSKDGLQVLKELRENKVQSMIIILTAKSTIEDRVEGLKAGADDYLSKPFAVAELLARIESLLRRHGIGNAPVLKVADIELNIETRVVRRASHEIQLTAKEFRLLELLIRNKNRVLTRREIAEQIWGYTFDTGTNVVDVYITYLRKAIDEGFETRLIQTVRGVGFLIKGD